MDISHDEYVQTPVPYERRGNGWSVFLIILGTQCGLPGIILSGEIFRSMGIGMGCLAIVAGTLLTGVLSSGTSYLGAKSGLSFAVITESVFGRRASMLVKLAIGLALVGWFASTCGLLGQSASAILRAHYGLDISPLAISAPISVLIVASVLFGAEGLERIGTIAAPAVGLAITGVMWMVWRGGVPHHAEAAASAGIWHGSSEFGRFVSAVVGSYVVGILIQPDYSRYVRRPIDAMAGTFGALSIAWPLVMIGGGVPAAISGHATLIEALPDAGLTLLAVLISVLCAWVDAAACLYSGSLALANLGGCVAALRGGDCGAGRRCGGAGRRHAGDADPRCPRRDGGSCVEGGAGDAECARAVRAAGGAATVSAVDVPKSHACIVTFRNEFYRCQLSVIPIRRGGMR
ncbi:permease for cytosine/purines [Gluconacetobacter liquefaciens]|uniref:Permease for cytosine/purines n=4 Tax=Gluconacetobacter liquefaciens TaxID=89584 RepID=A0A370FZG5_GLULI|nr:permease for cytosine/purines [Gluconacetobacter liquefaciens]